jgi:hypothetical protein
MSSNLFMIAQRVFDHFFLGGGVSILADSSPADMEVAEEAQLACSCGPVFHEAGG